MAETRATSSPGPEVVFDDPLRTGQAVAADLRRRGAQVVIALTHQDMAADRALAEAADVDVVLGGHEHEPLVLEEGKAIVVKAGSDGRYLVQVDLWLTREGRLVERSWTFREVSRRVPDDPDVAAIVKRYVDRLSRELDGVIGRSTVALEAHESKLRTQETNLGNFVADVMRARMDADVALVNGGGIRTDRTVPPGPLTKRDVHGLLPFTNVVMKLEVSGRALRAALEHGLAHADRLGGGFLQVSGVQVLYDPKGTPGNRITSVAVGTIPLVADRAYTVAVPGYVARGGDGFTMWREAKVLVDAQSGPDLAQLIVEAIVTRESVAPAVDGRLRAVAR
jgi:5'-nucleotidase